MHHCSEPPLSKTIVLARMGKEDVEGEGVGGEVCASGKVAVFKMGLALGWAQGAVIAWLPRSVQGLPPRATRASSYGRISGPDVLSSLSL